MLYNSALFKRHGLLVRSLLVLLHRGADSPQLTGHYARGFPEEAPDVTLRYRILRVWEVPAAQWLSGGPGTLPLAPLGDVAPDELPTVIARMKKRLQREVPASQAADLWSPAYILMGLRYEEALIQRLLQGVVAMKESVTYQAIINEGKAEGEIQGAQKILLLLGRDRFGEPSAEELAAIHAVTDVQKLGELSLRLLHASSWQELLGRNGAGRRRRGKKTS